MGLHAEAGGGASVNIVSGPRHSTFVPPALKYARRPAGMHAAVLAAPCTSDRHKPPRCPTSPSRTDRRRKINKATHEELTSPCSATPTPHRLGPPTRALIVAFAAETEPSKRTRAKSSSAGSDLIVAKTSRTPPSASTPTNSARHRRQRRLSTRSRIRQSEIANRSWCARARLK